MPVFKKFEPEDQIDNVLILEPSWELASGSSGWRGAPEGSASISLYGGHHRSENSVIREYKFERIIQGTNSFGVLSRSGPITASVNFVYMTDDELSISERTSERWGYEHWKTVMGLYDFYGKRNPDYSTASYDNYCLYFHSSSQNVVMSPLTTAAGYPSFSTSSFTIESWVKPFSTSSVRNTIQSLNRSFWFGVTGSTGMLVMSGAFGSVQSSSGLNLGKWNHVAYSYDSSASPSPIGTLYINNVSVGTLVHNPIVINSFTASLTIGAIWSGTLTGGTTESPSILTDRTGMLGTAFHGMIGESRIWSSARTAAQISGTHNVRLTGSMIVEPLACLQLSEGPLMQNSSLFAMGSGVLDHSLYQRSKRDNSFILTHGRLANFSDRNGPVWVPSDNRLFYLPKQLTPTSIVNPTETINTANVTRMRVISMPAGFYGRSIKRGSVRLTDNAFSSQGFVRTLVDDSRGGLYVSGSMFSSAGSRVEDYDGVEWNKVGNVFYDEGLIVIKDPALLDFGAQWSQSSLMPNDLLQLSFRGDSRVPIKTLMCRIDRGDLNASLNSTFWEEEEDGDRVRTNPSGSLYVTTVGLYNSEHELVGVARLAEPLKIRGNNRINIRLRMDF